jgi:hypothetical protein
MKAYNIICSWKISCLELNLLGYLQKTTTEDYEGNGREWEGMIGLRTEGKR